MIAAQGALTEDGELLPLSDIAPNVVEEIFRRLVLGRLHRAERLSEELLRSLLSQRSSGFSAHRDEPIEAGGRPSRERRVRSVTRAPIRIDAIAIDHLLRPLGPSLADQVLAASCPGAAAV